MRCDLRRDDQAEDAPRFYRDAFEPLNPGFDPHEPGEQDQAAELQNPHSRRLGRGGLPACVVGGWWSV